MAVVLAFLILGEPIRLGQVVGGVIIVVGVALTRMASRRRMAARA
jgi:drug/metabolite transporter (DMT)-like permease